MRSDFSLNYSFYSLECRALCVFLPIYSGRRVRWMYQPRSHRRKVAQDYSSTFLLQCMPLFFTREGFSRSYPSSTVKSNFMVFRNLNCKLPRRLSDALPPKSSKVVQKVFLAIGGICDPLQELAPTNVKTVHQTSSFHTENKLDRLGLLSSTYPRLLFSATKRINPAPFSFDHQIRKFLV